MRHVSTIGRVCCVVVGVLALSGAAVSQESRTGRVTKISPRFDPRTVDMDRQKASGELREQHEMLGKLVGEWKSKTLVFGAGPKPIENFGTAKVEAILGGRFIELVSQGNFMGSPVEGKSTIGYDNFMKHYTASVLSSQSTGIFISKGLASQDGSVIVFYGNVPEPALGLTDRTVRTVIRMLDSDTWVWEVHDLHITPEGVKVLETTYSR